jgi:hypothetical protein
MPKKLRPAVDLMEFKCRTLKVNLSKISENTGLRLYSVLPLPISVLHKGTCCCNVRHSFLFTYSHLNIILKSMGTLFYNFRRKMF